MRVMVWAVLMTLAVLVLLMAALGVFRPATGKGDRVIQGMSMLEPEPPAVATLATPATPVIPVGPAAVQDAPAAGPQSTFRS